MTVMSSNKKKLKPIDPLTQNPFDPLIERSKYKLFELLLDRPAGADVYDIQDAVYGECRRFAQRDILQCLSPLFTRTNKKLEALGVPVRIVAAAEKDYTYLLVA